MWKWQQVNSTDGILIRVINGFKALCTQSYDEMNKKRGLEFAASRIIIGAPPSTGAINTAGVYYSVLRTGSLPIDLKRREFTYDGTSIVADLFENPTFTGGTPDPVYNANGITSHTFEFELLVNITLTDEGTQFAPSIYALGPGSQTSKGVPNALYGSNYILAPNTDYLLKFYSTDTQNQNIAARIEGYEGELDVPNEDLA